MMLRVGRGAALAAAIVGIATIAACRQTSPPVVTERAAPPLPTVANVVQSPIMAPTTRVVDSQVTAAVAAPEPYISINFPTPVDVRVPLFAIAQAGHYGLVVPAEVTKKISITLDSVPLSVALRTVLDAAGLGLAPTTLTPAKLPYDTSVVFYQLPVNVDSLSADAIMKRFGVSRDIAELLVLSRIRP